MIVEDFMERLVAAEKGETLKDDLSEPVLFRHEINYAIRTWLDHRKHGTYPRAGAYNDQDPDLMEDWHTLNLYHSRVEHGVFSQLRIAHYAPDISSLTGG